MPVVDERRTRCAPSVPLTTVAVTPGLLVDELIAVGNAAHRVVRRRDRDAHRLAADRDVHRAVPSAVVLPNAADESTCSLATCVTATE